MNYEFSYPDTVTGWAKLIFNSSALTAFIFLLLKKKNIKLLEIRIFLLFILYGVLIHSIIVSGFRYGLPYQIIVFSLIPVLFVKKQNKIPVSINKIKIMNS